MAVTTSYGLQVSGSTSAAPLDSDGDMIRLPDGSTAYVGTDGAVTAGVIGVASFGGVTGVDPSLARLSNGNIVVAGESAGSIVYRIVAPNGATVVATTSVGDSGSTNPDVAALTGGGFVIVCQDAFAAPDNDVDVRVYDNSGVLSLTFSVDGTGADDRDAQVAALSNGNYVVAWTRTIGAESEIWFAIYDTAGSVIAAPQIHDTTGTINRNLSLCATTTGFAIAYEDNGWAGGADVEVTLSRHSLTGTLLGFTNVSNNAISDERPQVTQLANGLLAVSYGRNVNADTDIVVALVNATTGGVLTSQAVNGGFDQSQDVTNNAIAGFGGAGIRALAQYDSGMRYDTLQVTRTSTSDAAGDTIFGDDAIDIMNGNGGSDELFGAGGSDTLNGGAGDDTLDGGTGVDTLQGGLNNDAYYVDETADQVIEFVSEGIDTVYSSVGSYTLSGNVENLTLVGPANANGFGNDLSNILTGNAFGNRLGGGIGADTLIGGLGDDIYEIDNPNDVVVEVSGEGADTIESTIDVTLTDALDIEFVKLLGLGDLNFTGNVHGNNATGTAGDNILLGGGGGDTLWGLDGDDVLDGGVGADFMAGGLGDDTYYRDDIGDSIFELANEGLDHVISSVNYSLSSSGIENLTLTGTAITATGNDLQNILTGNGMDNVLLGGGAGDTLYGGAGADELDGGAFSDIMYGGAGDDLYYVDSTGDLVVELADEGSDRIISYVNYSLFGDTIEHLTLVGAAHIDGVGNELSNHITGNDGNNTLAGNGGGDVLDGWFGADLMMGGEGDDIFYVDDLGDTALELAGEGFDGVYSSVSFSLAGQELEYAYLLDAAGAANLTGNGQGNYLYGNVFSNVLDGGLGADLMTGGGGNDSYYLDDVGDEAVELDGEGTDQIYSTVSVNLSAWYVENAQLLGAADANLTGNLLNNVLTGNAGDNIFVGRGGHDTLTGGDGIDTADYREAVAGVTASLATGFTFDDGDGGQDDLAGIENLIGSHQSDALIGDAGANVLSGEMGDDTLTGGDGDDILRGGVGIDTLVGGGGVDHVTYSTAAAGVTVSLTLGAASDDGDGGTDSLSGIENLTGSIFNDVLAGSGADNRIVGGAGNDTVDGLNGNDLLLSGAGVDVFNGGGGIDTVDYSGAAAGMRAQLNTNASINDGDGATDTFSGVENLTGSAFNDILIGDGAVNVLRGGLGSDTLIGLGGADVLWGGAGALNALQGGTGDDLYVLEANDSITEFAAEGTDTVDARINTYVLANNVENLLFGGAGNFNGTGNALNNVITGGAGADVLRGRGGTDTLNGGLGIDTADYTLAAAGVVVRIDLQKATNDGDGATDTYTSIENAIGSNFNDVMFGDGNANVLMGGIGSDTLIGGGGNDILMGGSGGMNNQLQGGTGDDWYILDAFDTCVEFTGEGMDTVEARVGTYTLGNHVENLLYTGPGKFAGNGNALNNVLTGGDLNDILRGKGGDDIINGGLGTDEVQLRGVAADYTITAEGAGWRIVDSVGGRDGSTFVTSVEVLRYVNNTTTTLTYPPPAPGALESGGKGIGEALVSPLAEDDAFVLPALPGDEPLVLPGLEAFEGDGEPLVLPGAEEAMPLFVALEGRLAPAGDRALTLDHDGGIIGEPGRGDGGWMF
ncbi:calcium-binding protein [Roseibacterium beibuensis]|uniref:beta strand repeat-containing protein n=1 Tax=[Roseibacterium] beibuensis TaxID=1193142 RepID=UPI00217EFC6B|nr:calcium-binding protein [Roseibacterium beibuensis]MCS6627310.1 calcium-binding protein [Roseibacterium beibuensis]